MQLHIIAIFSAVAALALFYCFFGGRFMRFVITLTAFAAGALIAYQFAGVYFSTVFAKLAISLAGGLVLALLFSLLPAAGRFVIGLAAAAVLAVLVLSVSGISFSRIFWDVALAICMLLAVISAAGKKTAVRFSTALIGAFVFAIAAFYLFVKGLVPSDFASPQTAQDAFTLLVAQYRFYLLGATVLLLLAGMFVQFLLDLRKTRPVRYGAAYTPAGLHIARKEKRQAKEKVPAGIEASAEAVASDAEEAGEAKEAEEAPALPQDGAMPPPAQEHRVDL